MQRGRSSHAVRSWPLNRMPLSRRKMMKCDQNKEIPRHAQLTLHMDVGIYFCDPRQLLATRC